MLDTKQLKKISILYVEDDESTRLQTQKILEKLFKEVYVADNGEEGLTLYQTIMDKVDIIITDINMPKINGLDMITEINKMNKSIPTIVTSAHSDSENLLKAIDINIDKYITKPIQIRDLTLIIVDLVVKYKRMNNIENLAKNLLHKTTTNDKINDELNGELELLKNRNMYLSTIVDTLVINFKIDKNGNFIKVSSKFNSFFDYKEILGQNISILKCDTCSQESFQKLMLKAIHFKKSVISNYTLIRHNEKKVNADVTMTPFYNKDALVAGYKVFIDIL